MTGEQMQKELAAFCARMNEHTESIRVFVTLPENGMTASHSMGGGNYYAQVGQIQEWLDNRKGENQAIEIARTLPQPPPKEGEAWKD